VAPDPRPHAARVRGRLNSSNETQLDGAHRELRELYRRLAFVRPLSRERIRIEMRISQVRKRIIQLERSG
jgi:hypothetical protein